MNKNKKYILALAFVLVSSIIGISAYAATDTANPAGNGNFQRGMMRGGPNGQVPSGARPGFVNRGPRVVGTITKIDGNTLTVDSIGFSKNVPNTDTSKSDATKPTPEIKTYTVDASGATIYKNGVESKISDIAINDKIMVEGTITDTSVKATKIYEGNMGVANGANRGQGNWNNANGQNSNTQGQKVGFFAKIGNFFKNIFGKKN